jgi:hypothetical protein
MKKKIFSGAPSCGVMIILNAGILIGHFVRQGSLMDVLGLLSAILSSVVLTLMVFMWFLGDYMEEDK